MKKVRCISCGSDLVKSDFDYNDAHIHYICEECGEHFIDRDLKLCEECGEQVLDDEAIIYDEMTFCSNECVEKYKRNN